jgi:cobaltochelatase CobN
MPQRMALSLWAGETLRHQGIMEAQAMVALGVRPRWDDSGRPIDVEVIPQAQLGRTRVDVLLSVTGSYRDQFPSLMALLDQAVAAASQAEPGNAVALQTAQVAAQLRQRGVNPQLAQSLAQVRIFGNAPGDYGTGVAEAAQDDRLRRDDARLGELFLQRMSQPYLGGQPLAQAPGGAAAQALGAHLRVTDAAVLSRSSNLFGMLTSDDPFQYLGGLAAAARSAGKREPLPMYVNQLQDATQATTVGAQRSIALELQARYLHPGWLQAQKAEGYAGTLQVLKAVQFAWGWQAVAPGMVRPDHWQRFYEVLVKDAHGLGVPQWLRSHPQAYAQTLERLVQAQRLGHWQPDAVTQREVARLYKELTREAPLARELASVRRWVDGQTAPAQPAPARPVPQPREGVPPPAPPMGWVLRAQPMPVAADRADALLRGLAGLWMLGLMAAGGAWQLLRRRAPIVVMR